MRLFELAGHQFQDDLANVLKVMQGRANDQHTTSVVSWPAINQMMKGQGWSDITQDMLIKIKDQIDPNQELIQNVTDQGIVLKTDVASPDTTAAMDMPAGKSIDQMAHNAATKDLK